MNHTQRHIATARRLATLLLLLAAGLWIEAAAQCELQVPDFSVPPGRTADMPVQLTCDQDIVALQFTLTMPEGLTPDIGSARLNTERLADHQIRISQIAPGKYKALIASSANTPAIGRTGTILTIPVAASASLQEGSKLQMRLDDVVLASPQGDNLATGSYAGEVTILRLPDLAVEAVATQQSEAEPTGQLQVDWTVRNLGGVATNGGWQERIYLVQGDAARLIATTANDVPLAAGEAVQRMARATLPSVLGMHGKAKLKVVVEPTAATGEPSWLTANNALTAEQEIDLARRLTISQFGTQKPQEADQPTISFAVLRSGATDAAETVALSAEPADTRIQMPATITIEPGQSSAQGSLTIKANGQCDFTPQTRLTFAGESGEAQIMLYVEDDTSPRLEIIAANAALTEGDTLKVRVSTPIAQERDLPVQLAISEPGRFLMPDGAAIPAGSKSVDIAIPTRQNDIAQPAAQATLSAWAEGWEAAQAYIVLADDDIPELTLALSQTDVKEDCGPLAISATIRRLTQTDKQITIELSDDADTIGGGGIYYGTRRIVLRPGQTEAEVQLGPIDNDIVDADRTYTVNAAVYAPSCACTVAGGGAQVGQSSATLTVRDNDGPCLTLSAGRSALAEGSSLDITVRRNSPTAQPLDVSLAATSDRLQVPATVRIEAGQATATFQAASPANDTDGDTFTAQITAQAGAHSAGVMWLTVTDHSMPDATIAIASAPDTIAAGQDAAITLLLANTGLTALPAQTPFEVRTGGATQTRYLQEPLAPGQTVQIDHTINMPRTVGRYNIVAVVNSGRQIAETDYSNNSSRPATIAVVSPFTFSDFRADKTSLLPGETVRLEGKAGPGYIAGEKVEIYLIDSHGARQTIEAELGADGAFAADYTAQQWLLGEIKAGVCYPGEAKRTPSLAFSVLGIKLAHSGQISHQGRTGETVRYEIAIANPTASEAQRMECRTLGAPEGFDVQVEAPASIAPGAKETLALAITSQRPSPTVAWEDVQLEVKADIDGREVALPITAKAFFQDPKAVIACEPGSINTTVERQNKREIAFSIVNRGSMPTGDITLALPAWISSLTPATMASLAPGESAQVVLSLNTRPEWDITHIERGQIGVNCAKGDGVALPFQVEVVGAGNGSLTFNIGDSWSYELGDYSHLADLTVVLFNAAGEVVATATPDAEGNVHFDNLPAGPYTVKIYGEGHQDVNTTATVDPGRDTSIEIPVPAPNPTYDYQVEEDPDGVEDEYSIVTTVDYETNVPVPVIVIEGPQRIDGDAMAAGESRIINLTVTNRGLIAAENASLVLPDLGDEFSIECLTPNTPATLPAQSSRQIVCRITRTFVPERPDQPGEPDTDGDTDNPDAGNNPNPGGPDQGENPDSPDTGQGGTLSPCIAGFQYWYQFHCGKSLQDNAAAYRMAIKACILSDIYQGLSGWIGGSGGSGGGGGGGYGPSADSNSHVGAGSTGTGDQKAGICDPCKAELAEMILDMLFKRFPLVGPLFELTNSISNYFIEPNYDNAKNIADWFAGQLHSSDPISDLIDDIIALLSHQCDADEDQVAEWLDHVRELQDLLDDVRDADRAPAKAAPSPTKALAREAYDYAMQLLRIETVHRKFYGESYKAWNAVSGDELKAVMEAAQAAEGNLSDDQAKAVKPEAVSIADVQSFAKRFWQMATAGQPDADLTRTYDALAAYERECVAAGKPSSTDKFLDALHSADSYIHQNAGGVCASVTLQFRQSVYLTRQAFRGTLTVNNGHETEPMRDIKLAIVVKDALGTPTTPHEMEIHPEPEGQTGFDGDGDIFTGLSLAPASKGKATVIYIPTVHAAPVQPVPYYFGGTFSYTDPFTGIGQEFVLQPVELTVKPSPYLQMTYFMQRDVWGDDPMTADIVEPSREAEFSVLVRNVGKGDAENLRMLTQQPEIVANEKGLPLTVAITSTSIDDSPRTLVLGGAVPSDFGNVAAGGQTWGSWFFTSNLMGHFTDYDVRGNHVSSYGNPDLSLIDLDGLSIHELIHTARTADGKPAWAVNDVPDANDTPDAIWLTDGTVSPLMPATATLEPAGGNVWTLKVESAYSGWVFGQVRDPNYGRCKIEGVEGPAGPENPANFYLTDRTLRDGSSAAYEDLLHFYAYIGPGESRSLQYSVRFTPRPAIDLAVAAFTGVPDSVATRPVKSIGVRFTTPVSPATFTTGRIRLTVQGKPVPTDKLSLVPDSADSRLWHIGLGNLYADSLCAGGYYCLTVQTDSIADTEGHYGLGGRSATWNYWPDGKVEIRVEVSPAGAGTVSPINTTLFNYGDDIRFTETPAEGYDFLAWTIDGQEVGTDSVYLHSPQADITLTANYAPRQHTLRIEPAEGGRIADAAGSWLQGTLRADHGTRFDLTPVPDEGFEFDGWTLDGQTFDGTGDIHITLTRDMTLVAAFRQVVFTQQVVVEEGWNWLSSYLAPSDTANVFAPWSDFATRTEFIGAGLTKMHAPLVFLANISGRAVADHPVAPGALNGLAAPDAPAWPANADAGDAVLSLADGFALYDGSQWHGALTALMPGQGYIYITSAPAKSVAFATVAAPADETRARQDYPNVMALIARIDDVRGPLGQTLAAQCGDQARSSDTEAGGLHFLTIHGKAGDELQLIVHADDGTDIVSQPFAHQEGLFGSIDEPVVVAVDEHAVSTGSVALRRQAPDRVYSTAGVLMLTKPTQQQIDNLPAGVYVIDGKKKVVR